MRRVPEIALVCCLTACGGPRRATPAADDVPLEWLVGTWESEGEGTVTVEQWVSDGAGGLRGLGRTRTRAGETVHHELLRIEHRGSGWAYRAAPAGQAPAAFELERAGPDEAVFANPAHDFPKRIAYRRADDTLRATISGDDGQRRASWTFRRTGDAPAIREVRARLCRAGDELTLTIPPCTCGAEIYCRVVGAAPLALELAVVDHSCDACAASTGACGPADGAGLADGACRAVTAPALVAFE